MTTGRINQVNSPQKPLERSRRRHSSRERRGQQQQTLKQNCSSCRKSNDLTGYKSRQSRQEMFQDTHTHAIEDRHTVEILRTELDRNQARAGGEIDLE